MKKIKEFLKYLKNTSAAQGGKWLLYAFIAASVAAGIGAYCWNKYALGLDIHIF